MHSAEHSYSHKWATMKHSYFQILLCLLFHNFHYKALRLILFFNTGKHSEYVRTVQTIAAELKMAIDGTYLSATFDANPQFSVIA
jgi:hypothetical protein